MRYYPPSALRSKSRNSPPQIIRVMDDIGTNLGFPIFTLLEAKRLFHEFYLGHSLSDHQSFDIALACLLTASKLDDTLKKARDVSYETYHNKEHPYPRRFQATSNSAMTKVIEEIRKRVVNLESMILESISYDFVTCPVFNYTVKFTKSLGGLKEHCTKALGFANDFYKHSSSVHYPPSLIAASAVMMTLSLYGHSDVFDLDALGIPEGEMSVVQEIAKKMLENMMSERDFSLRADRAMYEELEDKIIQDSPMTMVSPTQTGSV